ARDPLRAVPERVLQPDGDLFGRTIGERDGADALRCEPSGVDEMVDPGDEAERLPGAGSRHHEDGTERRFDGEALLRKRVEIHEGNLDRSRLDLSLRDRKSTRLNSSHVSISYAVF